MNPTPISTDEAEIKEELKRLLKLNTTCADCGADSPGWAAVNLGIFVCIVCAGIHRHLGVHISRIKSVTLDSWKSSELDFMRQTSNKKAKEYWENTVPSHLVTPSFGDSIGLKEQWIRSKYQNKSFIPITENEDPSIKRINFDMKEGWIVKKGEVVKNWKKRWLRLVEPDTLYYYKGSTEKNHCGFISLRDSGQIDCVSEVDSKPNCFIISTPKRRFLLSCLSGDDMLVWILNIRAAVLNLQTQKQKLFEHNLSVINKPLV
eukprot:gene1353-1708_t